MPIFIKALKLLNVNTSPTNLALSASVGLMMGMLPSMTLLPWLILPLLLLIRLNAVAISIVWVVGEGIMIALNQPINLLGETILNSPLLESTWQELYNQTFWRLVNFNHTFAMGSSVFSVLIFIPAFFTFLLLCKKYQSSVKQGFMSGIANKPIIKKLFKVDETKKISFFKTWVNFKGILLLGILSGLVVATTFLLQNYLGRQSIEKHLTQALGSPVSISDIELSLSPIGFEIQNLSIAGAKDETKTALSIEKLKFAVSLYHAAAKRLVFEQIEISEAYVNLEQLAIKNKEKSDSETKESNADSSFLTGMSLPQLPSTNQVFANEKLTTVEKSKALRKLSADTRTKFQQSQQTLPDEKAFSDYQQRVNKLKKISLSDLTSLGKNSKKIAVLKIDIDKDIKSFEKEKNSLDSNIKTIVSEMKSLPSSPEEDLANLRKKYSLDEGNRGNLMHLLLGEKAAWWTNFTLHWYKKIKPAIQKLNEQIDNQEKKEAVDELSWGKFIAFTENDPQPKLNIKQIIAKSVGDHWQFNMSNINFNHPKSQLPTLGDLTITEKGNHSKKFNLLFDYRQNPIVNNLSMDHVSMPVQDQVLLAQDSLSLIIKSAIEDSELEFNLTDDEKISGYWERDYREIVWDQTRMKKSTANRARPGLFEKIKDFNNKIAVSGSLSAPDFQFRSNLDDRLYSLLIDSQKQALNQLEVDVKKRLSSEADSTIKESNQDLIVLNKQRESLKKKIALWRTKLLDAIR